MLLVLQLEALTVDSLSDLHLYHIDALLEDLQVSALLSLLILQD